MSSRLRLAYSRRREEEELDQEDRVGLTLAGRVAVDAARVLWPRPPIVHPDPVAALEDDLGLPLGGPVTP